MGLKQQQKMLKKMLPAIGREYSKDRRGAKTLVTGFLAAKGKLYRHELMVVGRAVNSWNLDNSNKHQHIQACKRDLPPNRNNDSKYPLLSKLTNKEIREQFAQRIADSVSAKSAKLGCPMKWVQDRWQNNDGYNTAKSAFWRVIRRVMEQLKINGGDDAWPSRLVWSNLYKIAPAGGGNPAPKLRKSQFEECKELLLREIEDYKPRRVLFLTGWEHEKGGAEKFLAGKKSIKRKTCNRQKHKYVCAAGLLNLGNKARVVVAVHPQCKKKTFG